MLNFTYDSCLDTEVYRESNRKADAVADEVFGDFLPGDQAKCRITEVENFAGKYRITVPDQGIPILSFFAHQVKGSVVPCKNAVFIEYSKQHSADFRLDDGSLVLLAKQRVFFVSKLQYPKSMAIEGEDLVPLHQLCILRPKRNQTGNKHFCKGLVIVVLTPSLAGKVTFVNAEQSDSFRGQCPQLIHTLAAFERLVHSQKSFLGYDILSHLRIVPAKPLIEALVKDYKDNILPGMTEGAVAKSSPSSEGSSGNHSPKSIPSIPSFESDSPTVRLDQPLFKVTDSEDKEYHAFFRPSSRLIKKLRSNIDTLDVLAREFVLCTFFNKRQYQYPHNQTLKHEASMFFLDRKERYEETAKSFDSRFAYGTPAVRHLRHDEASFENLLQQLTDLMGGIGTYGHAGDWGGGIVNLQLWVSNLSMKELDKIIDPLVAAFLQSNEEGFQYPLEHVDCSTFMESLSINEGMQDESCNAIALDFSHKMTYLLAQLSPVFEGAMLKLFFSNCREFFVSDTDLCKEEVRGLYEGLKGANQPYLNEVAIAFRTGLSGFWYCDTIEEKSVVTSLLNGCQQYIKNEEQFLWLLKVLAKSKANVIDLFCNFLRA